MRSAFTNEQAAADVKVRRNLVNITTLANHLPASKTCLNCCPRCIFQDFRVYVMDNIKDCGRGWLKCA